MKTSPKFGEKAALLTSEKCEADAKISKTNLIEAREDKNAVRRGEWKEKAEEVAGEFSEC